MKSENEHKKNSHSNNTRLTAEPHSFKHFSQKAWFTALYCLWFLFGTIHRTFVECSKATYADVTFKVVEKFVPFKTVLKSGVKLNRYFKTVHDCRSVDVTSHLVNSFVTFP